MTPDMSLVIVNWNVADLLAQCLTSIWQAEVRVVDEAGVSQTNPATAYPTVEVIVIDSASHDNSVAMLKERFAWVRLAAYDYNIGFVKGTNRGLAMARGATLMLLNPDTEVFPSTLRDLWAYLQQHPTVGIVGPHTLNSDGTHQSSRRRFPTVATAIFESTWLEGYAPKGLLARFRVEDMADDGVGAVDWVQGSALLMQRAVYEQIGGLDERYIMYSEELDFCKRAKLAGWAVHYIGTARLIHHSGQSTAQVKTRSQIHFQHSKLRYFRKFHGRGAAWLLRGVLVLNYKWQMVVEGGKWLVGHKRALRAQRLAAYWAVLKSLLWRGETGLT